MATSAIEGAIPTQRCPLSPHPDSPAPKEIPILDVSRTESAVSGGFSTDYFLGFFVSKTLTTLISRSRTDSPTSSVMNSWNSSAIRTHAGSLCSRSEEHTSELQSHSELVC